MGGYGMAWGIWVGVVAGIAGALWFGFGAGTITNFMRLVGEVGVVGVVIGPVCRWATRNPGTDGAMWIGFLVGMGGFALLGAVLFIRTSDPEGRAFIVSLGALGAVISGIGGAVVGAFNARGSKV